MGDKIAAILRHGGIAVKDCWQGGSHGIVTLYCREMAEKAARILQAATFTVDGPKECLDYAKENRRTCLLPSTVKVWRVWFRV